MTVPPVLLSVNVGLPKNVACTTPLLSGAVSYAPDPLEPPADGEVLICCARPSADIVLDM